jgi:uncharacterized membrane protein YoaK (UPF0700 family)
MNSFAIAVVLAWIAGFVDAVGYVVLSHVFTAYMSGNTVATATQLDAGQWLDISRRFFPIPMFVLGVFIGSLMGHAMQNRGLRRRFAPSFILEFLLLLIFVVTTLKVKNSDTIAGIRTYPLVALLAIAMGLQNATLRRVKGMAVRTTFITGMLVAMAERAAGYVTMTIHLRSARHRAHHARINWQRQREKRRALRYGLLWCGLFIGAGCGAGLERLCGTIVVLLPALGLLVIIIQDFIRPISEQ